MKQELLKVIKNFKNNTNPKKRWYLLDPYDQQIIDMLKSEGFKLTFKQSICQSYMEVKENG